MGDMTWLFGSNAGLLDGVKPPESFDLQPLAEFAFNVLARVTHASDLNVDFFKQLMQDASWRRRQRSAGQARRHRRT